MAEYVFASEATDTSHLLITLSADTGSFDTRKHRIVFEAQPASGGGTAIEFRYHYETSQLAPTSMRV